MEGTGEVRCLTPLGRVVEAAATVLIRMEGLACAFASDNSAIFLRIQAVRAHVMYTYVHLQLCGTFWQEVVIALWRAARKSI
jgi:hypothetical protein